MTNTQTVRIDLTSPGGFAPVIHAVAGDIYSRFVRMELYQGGVLYEPPSGTTCVIGWRRGETYGAYSSILEEDGSSSHPAWELEDNVLTIELDWHVCQHPGDVAVNVSLNGEGGSRLHTWELCCRVARGAVADAEDPTKPSESATDAANRAEAAANRAEAAAERSEAVADELENIVKDGPVVSVNGKTGRVQLSASDIPFDNAGTPFVSTTVQDAIEELLGIGTASSTIMVTAPAGVVVTVSKGDKSYTQTVGEDGAALSFKVFETGEWTVSAVLNGRLYKRTVNVAEAGGSYSVELSYFSATLTATAVAGATVTATCGETVVTGQAAGNGQAALEIKLPGNYVVQALVSSSYGNASSNSQAVNVTDNGGSYTATVKFCRLTVTIDAGSAITVAKGDVSISLTGTGSDMIYLPSTGTWTVTASKDDLDASAEVECSGYQDYTCELAYIQEVLADNSWEMIRRVSDADEGANWWSVGDTKPVALNGTVGILTLNNLTVDAFILGFNHNSGKEGTHRIHFALGKIGGKLIGLCDSQYNNYGSSTRFHMNSSDSNNGGWNQSYMRRTILGNTGTPDSPPANSLLAALPADLRAVMKSVTKYTDNTGNSGNSSGAVTATQDYMFLLAEFEAYGRRTYANQYEQNSQQQYDYFKAGNAKLFYNHGSTGSVVWAWSRSPGYSSDDSYFVVFNTDGTAYNHYANSSGVVCVGFAA